MFFQAFHVGFGPVRFVGTERVALVQLGLFVAERIHMGVSGRLGNDAGRRDAQVGRVAFRNAFVGNIRILPETISVDEKLALRMWIAAIYTEPTFCSCI